MLFDLKTGETRESVTWTNEAQEQVEHEGSANNNVRKRSTCSRYELLFSKVDSQLNEPGSRDAQNARRRDKYAQDFSESSLQLRLATGDNELHPYFEHFFEIQSVRDGLNALDAKIQVGFVVAIITVLFFFCYYHPKHVQRSLEVNLQRMLDQQFSQLREHQSKLYFSDERSSSRDSKPAETESEREPETDCEMSADASAKQKVGKIQVCVDADSLLGHGANGTAVYRGTFESRSVAVKRTVKSRNVSVSASLEESRELEMLRSVQHPNLVHYYCVEEDINFRYLALELCQCTLDQYLLADSGSKTPTDLQTQTDSQTQIQNSKLAILTEGEICSQILKGLCYLHSLNIVHR